MNPTKTASRRRLLSPTSIGYIACVWALIFGVVHIYWAVGGTVGLQGHSMAGLLFVINLVAIPLCFVAAVVALAIAKSWTGLIPPLMWHAAAWGASAVLALRGTVGILQSLSQNHVALLLLAYDSWFLLGGILFGLAAISNHRR